MIQNYKLQEVFVSVGLPEPTFARRPNLERAIRAWRLLKTKHLLIYGPSKSGKTSLWKKHVSVFEGDLIKIPCNSNKFLGEVYATILSELSGFYLSEKTKESGTSANSSLAAEFQVILTNFGISFGKEDRQSISTTQARISPPAIDTNLVIKFLRESGKFIVLEDFHYANDEFKRELSQDLKAFSDEKCPWILVGVTRKTSDLITYNLDLQQRISLVSVGWFSDEKLEEIIDLGEIALNIKFSDEVKSRIISASLGSASILQTICLRICILKNVYTTEHVTVTIDELALVKNACQEIAEEDKAYYEALIGSIYSKANSNSAVAETFKWLFKLIRERDIPEKGLPLSEVVGSLKELGWSTVQSRVLANSLGEALNLLQKERCPVFFEFDETQTFFLLDKGMKFIFKWIPTLID